MKKLVCALLFAVIGRSQTDPVIKTTTRLVQVSVIAKEHDRPVDSLKAENFHVLVDGQRQKIAFFAMESSAHPLDAAPPLEKNVYVNTMPARGQTQTSVTILLLDLVNTRLTDRIAAQRQMIKYLMEIPPQERIGVYLFNGNLRVLHNYTADMTVFQQQLAEAKDKLVNVSKMEEPSAVQLETSDGGSMLGSFGASAQERAFYLQNRVLGTLHVLKFIANHLAELPGRKNIVWLSGGFPINFGLERMSNFSEDFSNEVEDTIRALSDANVAIYPIDAHGLVGVPSMDASRNAPPSTQAGRGRMPDPTGTNFLIPLHQTMDLIAQRTGGHAFYNTNGLTQAIHEAVDDSSVSYTLGFYPENEKYNREFHKIKVEVDQPHINLHYRAGYLDLGQVATDDALRSNQLHEAVWSPLDSTELGLVVRLEHAPQGMAALNVAVGIQPRGIQLKPEGDRYTGRLDVLIVPVDSRNVPGKSQIKTLTMNLKPDTYKKFVTSGATLRDTVPVAADTKTLRIIVRDYGSGLIGSLTVPAEVQ